MLNYLQKTLTSKEIRIHVAQRLHKLRIESRLTLDELAEKTGYSKPTVQRWERGWKTSTGDNIIPTMDQLIELCALYECEPEYILCEIDERIHIITDISKETGLQSETIQKLHDLSFPLHAGKQPANILFLTFINYFIQNIDLINELLYNRQELIDNAAYFREDSEYHTVMTAYTKIMKNQLSLDIFKDGIFEEKTGVLIPLQGKFDAYYRSIGYDEYNAGRLAYKAIRNLDYLSLAKEKQSDFALSDSFLDIVKPFFEKKEPLMDEYSLFIQHQR